MYTNVNYKYLELYQIILKIEMLKEKDLLQIKEKGIEREQIEYQLSKFKNGYKELKILRPALYNDGIRIIDHDQCNRLINYYEMKINNGLIPEKFVPASGAATRMFKELYAFLNNGQDLSDLPSDHGISNFISHLHRFAFFPLLSEKMPGIDINEINVRRDNIHKIINILVNTDGLNYGQLPKGLIHFHLYDNEIRTAMEEHLLEGSKYASNRNGHIRVHFTVSPEHYPYFQDKLSKIIPVFNDRYKARIYPSFSFQKPETDTIAVTKDNKPFRDKSGMILFRPGGHGALLDNLNERNADIIFIKNIDNVIREEYLRPVITFKKALAGLLTELKNRIGYYLKVLHSNPNEILLREIRQFIKNELFTSMPRDFDKGDLHDRVKYSIKFLNRPIRVCGMVKNQGEPGGGPFWVEDESGQESLQILEKSQFNLNDKSHAEILASSTHFNPVDIVCSIFDYNGRKFDLRDFIDPETGFISEKSYNGEIIKALELPGLWNGGMSDWITVFVEVPIDTFNPVKTINDLLRPKHQP